MVSLARGRAKVPEMWPGDGTPQVIDPQDVLHDIFSSALALVPLGRRTQAAAAKDSIEEIVFRALAHQRRIRLPLDSLCESPLIANLTAHGRPSPDGSRVQTASGSVAPR